MMEQISREFRRLFGRDPLFGVRAPGRVNLIGEHTDYNQGLVMPAAIDLEIQWVVAPRRDRMVRLQSLNMGPLATFSLDDTASLSRREWWSYVAGVAWSLEGRGRLEGMDGVLTSTIPVGSGLSSSAALEVSAGLALLEASGLPLGDMVQLAIDCQRGESEFVGVKCGIMDQMAVATCREGTALLLDCLTLASEAVPLPPEATIVVCDSRKRRSLSDSSYNVRRQECEQALEHMRHNRPELTSLRDLTPQDLPEAAQGLDERLLGRIRHVITENQRVQDSRRALSRGDLESFGRWMDQSHQSLRDDYEVSCYELDALVEAARQAPGCLGSRLTGAGFGGCTVSLVLAGKVGEFTQEVVERYREATGLDTLVMPCKPAGGARVWPLG